MKALNTQHYSLILAALAGLCWAAVLALLLFGGLNRNEPLELQRLLFYALALAAPILTFVPIERAMGLVGLTIEGTLGIALLLYTLAFVPAPQEWLLALPDLPIYGLLLMALLLCGAAIARPFIHAATMRLFQSRARAFDGRRVRRQSYEVGLFLTLLAAFAGLRVLTWVSMLLLAVVLVIAEMLFLARVPAE
ncbi:MAG: hypothetical protein EI684_05580 [Candidatus Viridilinea halotolerans]|uniref:Uncharacterized protein n=1 Tax=Candidatus Viridilinea halotolerans TaxID=2491704 RepID=A0A426U558_9CHLR|nr:MAG: hypothetical protein EI684_05580 [Candidatus Viridilinea halotolerans]